MNKRGQVVIFVIVAIAIVGVLAAVFLFPRVREGVTGTEFSPNSFLSDCVAPEVERGVSLLAMQGGYAEPEGFILNDGVKIKYLCYSAKNYEPCAVQQPMIKNNFEAELGRIVTPAAEQCVRNLKSEYEKRGYSVSASAVDTQLSIIPGKIRVDFLAPMTITRDSTETFRGFDVELKSEMYDLLMTSQSIVDFESEFGDSETTLYLQYYPDLKIDKTKLDDGSTIYKLSNVVTKEEFTFASRSVAWPAGYGL